MKQGGNGTLQRGFTMVEVLIVLAVTSSLLVIAMVIINGRLQKTEFAVGSRQIRQEIEGVINEAGSGFSASQGNFRCMGSTMGGAQNFGAGATAQGKNASCIFVGKVIVLGTNTGRVGSMRVVPVSGNRQYSGASRPRNVTSLVEARPTAIAPSSASGSIPDQSETITLPRGFSFSGAWAETPNTSFASKFALGVISDLGGGEAQHFTVYGIDRWSPGDSVAAEVDAINSATVYPSTNKYTMYKAIHLCFAHDGTGQSAELTLGRSGGLGVETAIREGATCGR